MTAAFSHIDADVHALTTESPDAVTVEAGAVPTLSLHQFIAEFGDDLLQAVERELPPVYHGQRLGCRDAVLEGLKRKPFDAQRDTVHAATTLLVDRDEQACVLNCDMGTGKVRRIGA